MQHRAAAAAEASRLGIHATWSTLIGIVLSGPLALAVLATTHPQPPWRNAESFVRAFHVSQTLPYFAGFFLVGGYALLMASLHAGASEERKPRTAAVLVLTSAFVSLVFLNYIVQTTFIPALVAHYDSENAPIVAALSMTNPASLAWAIEMWAWALLGAATWIVAPVFSGSRLERITGWVFVANGVVSVLSALITSVRPAWVMTSLGLAGYSLWNVLVFAMSILALLVFRRRIRDERDPAPASSAAVVAHQGHA